MILSSTGSGGMADASDSKSDTGNSVWVQVPPSRPHVRRPTNTFNLTLMWQCEALPKNHPFKNKGAINMFWKKKKQEPDGTFYTL